MSRFVLPALITVFLIGTVTAGAFFYWQKQRPVPGQLITSDEAFPSFTPMVNTPTPMPFRELTIPYLREQNYQSSLGQLEETFRGSNYTAYVTNYTSDSLKINGLLTKPAGEMPPGGWPAVVFVHGYIPPATYRTTEKYVDYVDYLARNGFVVFKIDLRGHGESEGEPGGAYYSPDYVIDTLNAYAALQSSGFVNPKQIGLWGHSMAGNIVMRSMATKPEIPAVVIWGGAVYTYLDMVQYRITDSSYQPSQQASRSGSRREGIRQAYGEPTLDNPFWQQVAPVTYLNDIKGAIQIHHAVDDDVVSIEYTRNLKMLLDATSVRHEEYEYPNGGHNISGPSFGTAMQRTVEFYKENLTSQ